jgi:hypothetical protein
LAFAQRRTAATWIAGFLGPQLLSPIVFWFLGSVAAGQVGLTLAATTAPLLLALSWLQARYPEYGRLVARKDLARLDNTAARATIQAIIVCSAGISAIMLVIVLLRSRFPALGGRFLPFPGVVALSATSIAYLLYQAMAAHLRAHREESLFWPALLGTAAAIVSAAWGARRTALAATVAYAIAILGAFLPLATAAFLRRRRILHASPSV